MTYDPKSLIAELKDYQEYAEEAFSDGLVIVHERHPYGSAFVAEGKIEAPDTIEIDTIDDIIPLAIYLHELTYRLTAINEGKATYSYEG